MASSNKVEQVIIRSAKESDCYTVVKLINDSAKYNKIIGQITTTIEDLKREAFNVQFPVVYVLVAELSSGSTLPESSLIPELETENKAIVGYALYFDTYSTWSGRALHLENIYLMPEFRCKGTGRKIMQYLGQIIINKNYARLSLECPEWNESAINFFKKYGAEDVTISNNWESYRFSNEALKRLNLKHVEK